MKFSLKREIFLKSLNICSKSLITKPSLPILSNILISAKKAEIEIVSTNLESATKVRLKGEVEREGDTTVSGRVFLDYVSQINGDLLNLEKLGEEVIVQSDSYSARFATTNPSEFPAIPTVTSGKTVKISAKVFVRAVEEIVSCAAQDESRPILTGVLVSVVKNKLTMVATDGYRLGYTREVTESDSGEASFVVPARSLAEVVKIIQEEGEGEGEDKEKASVTILIADSANQILFKFGEVEYISRLIEGEFPNWQKIIPTDFSTKAIILKEDLVRTIKVASIFARDSGNIIKLSVEAKSGGKGSISASATTQQVGSGSASVDVELEGKGGEIAFNYRYVLEALSVMVGDKVFFEMNESLNPGRITSSRDPKDFFHIIMPVRLQA